MGVAFLSITRHHRQESTVGGSGEKLATPEPPLGQGTSGASKPRPGTQGKKGPSCGLGGAMI